MKIKADRFNQWKNRWENIDMEEMNYPVDLYGKRVYSGKSEENLKKAAKDIQTRYDLEGTAGFTG